MRVSGGVSEGPGRPPPKKKSKMSLRSQKTGELWLGESPKDSFFTRSGGRLGPLGDSPETRF